MKHIVMFSGGIGSYIAAKRVVSKFGSENVILVFADTKTEDEDLYRFKDDVVSFLGVELVELSDGRDVWQVAFDDRFLFNSRVAKCSSKLKQRVTRRWLKENYDHDECYLYLGIDWTEAHRQAPIIKSYAPYWVGFPMCEEPYLDKHEMLAECEADGIAIPRLYKLGFAHNNSGGFCFRAGVGHFKNLLDKMPERYKYHEDKEQELIKYLDREYPLSILVRTRGGVKQHLTLKQLRVENAFTQMDIYDVGGCGCFLDEEDGFDE